MIKFQSFYLQLTLLSAFIAFSIGTIKAQEVFEDVYYEPAPINYQGLDNSNTQAFASKAFDYIKNLHNRNAQELFDSILIMDKNNVLGTYGLAYCKFADGDYENSIEILDPLINVNLQNAALYSQRARNYMVLENLEKAIADFQKAAELGTNENDLLSLSECFFYSGDFNASVAEADSFIKKQTQKPIGYFVKGMAKSGLKDYADAIEEFNKVIEINPKNSVAYYHISRNNMLMQDFNKALKNINKAIKLDAENAEAFELRAEIKYNTNDYSNAIFDCNHLIEIDEASENTYLTRAKSYIKLGLKKEACADLTKAKQLGSKDVEDLMVKHCK